MGTTTVPTQPSWRHALGIRWKLWRHNATEFWREMRKHPVAVAGGIVVIFYVLAAIFAAQITWHDPELGSLRNRLVPPVFLAGGTWGFPTGHRSARATTSTRIVYRTRVSLSVGHLGRWVSLW